LFSLGECTNEGRSGTEVSGELAVRMAIRRQCFDPAKAIFDFVASSRSGTVGAEAAGLCTSGGI
jgi:hypothetical protein